MEYDANRHDICFLKVTLIKLLLLGNHSNQEGYQFQKDRFLREEGYRDTFTSIGAFLEGTSWFYLFRLDVCSIITMDQYLERWNSRRKLELNAI